MLPPDLAGGMGMMGVGGGIQGLMGGAAGGMPMGGFNMGPPPGFGGPPGMQGVLGGMMGGAGAMMGPGRPPISDWDFMLEAGRNGQFAQNSPFGPSAFQRPQFNRPPGYGNMPQQGQLRYASGGGGGGRGGGGGGGGMMPFGAGMPFGGGPSPQDMMAGRSAAALYGQFQAERDRANAANEGRYNQGFGMFQQMHDKSMADVGNMTGQRRADLNRRYDEQGAASQQSLIDRGLGNTTITENFRMGNERERGDQLNRLTDQEIERRVGTRERTVLPWINFIEGRQDVGPDMGMMSNLAMQAGSVGIPLGGMMGGGGYGGDAYGNPALARRMGWRTGGETGSK